MSSTCLQPHSPSDFMHDRLDRLATLDPDSADQLRPILSGPLAHVFAPDYDELDQRTLDWTKTNVQEASPDIVIALGTGSGQELPTLLSQLSEDAKLFVMEYDAARAADAFRKWPLEKEIEKGRLTLSIGHDTDKAVDRLLERIRLQDAPSFRLFDCSDQSLAAENFYQATLRQIHQHIHLNIFNLGTLIYRGPMWQFNTITNLPSLFFNPSIESLSNVFSGKPAVVVGAGPSLDRSKYELAKHADGFVVISTGTALKPLQQAGIRPDLVVAVDGSSKTAPQFETDCGDLYLGCSSLVFPPVLEKFKGNFNGAMSANPIGQWLNQAKKKPGTIAAAGTVTTTAIDIARKMGCGPILCLGVDLCFEDDGTTHSTHSMYHQNKVDTSRLTRVAGNYQPEVFTSEQFHCYICLLEQYIQDHDQTTFINITSQGARIEGMDLEAPERLGDYASKPFDSYQVIEQLHKTYEVQGTEDVLSEMDEVVEQLSWISTEAQHAAMYCNRLILMLRRPKKDDERAAREILTSLKQIDEKITQTTASSRFLEMSLRPIGFASGTRPTLAEERLSEAILANKRSRDLYEQIAGAARWTLELLAAVRADFRQRLQTNG